MLLYMTDFQPLLEYSLSDLDIKEFFKNKINVIKFSELPDYKSMDDVIGKYKRCIILNTYNVT